MIQICRLYCFSRCGPATEKFFSAYCTSHSATVWTNNITIKHTNDPADTVTTNLATITESTNEMVERDTHDLSDNSNAVSFDKREDLNISKYRQSKSTVLLSTNNYKNKDYICDSCQRTFKRKYHLIHHIMDCKNHSINQENPSTTRAKVTKKSRKSDNSTVKQKDFSRLKKDRKSTGGNEDRSHVRPEKSLRKRSGIYSCSYCDHAAEKKKLLKVHLTEAHPEFARKNRKSFVSSETVLRARIEHDGKVYYHCSECGKNLNSPYTFYWHIRIHTGERLFTCHLCGKRFRVNQGLARHLRETHAGIKNVSCDLCGRMFSTRRNAEDHRRIHTGERPYICNVCGKTFKQKASLFVHNRTHTDVFPFKCSYCEQTFRTRPPLMVHITKHTGEKPYACDVCGRCFRIKYELKRHRLIHSDEKPWRCTDCNLSFRQKRYLVNHKKLNHESPRCLTATK